MTANQKKFIMLKFLRHLRALQLYTFELKKGQAFEQSFENF